MRTDSNLTRGLTAVGCLSIFLALMPGARSERGGVINAAELEHLKQHSEDQPWIEDYRLGWPGSPLVHSRSEQTLTAQAGGYRADRSFEWEIALLSWSALTLAIGIGLVWLGRRMRPTKLIPSTQPHIADDLHRG
jgi:hypothetical protein